MANNHIAFLVISGEGEYRCKKTHEIKPETLFFAFKNNVFSVSEKRS